MRQVYGKGKNNQDREGTRNEATKGEGDTDTKQGSSEADRGAESGKEFGAQSKTYQDESRQQ